MDRGTGTELDVPAEFAERRVQDAMLSTPKVLSASAAIAEVEHLLQNEHVHSALLTDSRGLLITVLERADLGESVPSLPAAARGTLAGRTVHASAELAVVWIAMIRAGSRRLAVVDDRGVLVGLLCLKGTGRGFCTDIDVQSRAVSQDREQRAER